MAPVLKVRPSVQGDVLQDFLPVFRYSMSPQIAMPMKSFWKGQENPKLGYVLILCRMCFFSFSRWKVSSVTYLPVNWPRTGVANILSTWLVILLQWLVSGDHHYALQSSSHFVPAPRGLPTCFFPRPPRPQSFTHVPSRLLTTC